MPDECFAESAIGRDRMRERVPFTERSDVDAYERFCRPLTVELLRGLRLDRTYHRAEGDLLYYRNAAGEEQSVLDLVGGYGACLFGHNHPELRALFSRLLEQCVPFHAQASRRAAAGELGQKLNAQLAMTGREYVVTLANSGAEAVEAALKHAELVRYRRLQTQAEELRALRARVMRKSAESGLEPGSPDEFAALSTLPGDVSSHPGSARTASGAVWDAVEARFEALRSRPSVFLSLEGAFHGKTSGALQLTHNALYREPFAALGPRVRFLRFADLDDVRAAIRDATVEYTWPRVESGRLSFETRRMVCIAGLFIEPLQGEGGIREVPADYLTGSRQLASEHGFALVLDEIQCGMGRTGDFLASTPSGIVADYYLLSKSLGGGLCKLSALLIDRAQYVAEFGLIHSSTFAEDEHSARVASRALDLLASDGLLERAHSRGAALAAGLTRLKERFGGVVSKVSGRGLMLGLELRSQLESGSNTFRLLSASNRLGYVAAGYLLHEHRIRLMPTLSDTNVLRLEPSAYITAEACASVLRALEQLCSVLERQNAYHLTRYLVDLEEPGSSVEIRSYRSAAPTTGTPRPERSVAFVGHCIDVVDMPRWDRSLEQFTPEQLRTFLDRTWRQLVPVLHDEQIVTSATGARVGVQFIGLCVDSRIIGQQLAQRQSAAMQGLVEASLELAEERSCTVLGLGGYTSIVTRNGMKLAPSRLALTTGNSLTVAMGLEALLEAARELQIDLGGACFGALGAAGNIGSVYSELMAEIVPRVVLVGRPHSEARLATLAATIYEQALTRIASFRHEPLAASPLSGIALVLSRMPCVERALADGVSGRALHATIARELGPEAPVRVATELDALREAQLILAASNAPEPLIYPFHLAEGPVVICDISVPADTAASVARERRDVKIIQGGVVSLTGEGLLANANFEVPGIPLEPGTAFACMAETILLGLEGTTSHYSYGPIEAERVKQSRELARRHGFQLARARTERTY